MNIKNIIYTLKNKLTNIKQNKLTIKQNKLKYGVFFFIFILLILLILLIYHFFYKNMEAFSNKKHHLTDESIEQYLKIQTTINKNINFDVDKLKHQVTQKEMNYFLTNGQWPWSQEVIDLYTEAINKNVFVRTHPLESIKYARTIYNQKAILEILSLQTKEGNFLIHGVSIHDNKPNPLEDLPSGFGSFGYTSSLISPKKDIIKCNIDPFGNDSKLERIHFTGKGVIYGEQTKKITQVNYKYLEEEIPGFKFIHKPCNPCKVFNTPADYSCKFRLTKLSDESPSVSSVWKYLWSN